MPPIVKPKRKPTSAEIGSDLVQEVRLALGQEPDLVLWRNSVAGVEVYDEKRGTSRWQHAGLPKGSADLVGILAVTRQMITQVDYQLGTFAVGDMPPLGVWFCLEVKANSGRPTKQQTAWLDLVRKFGGFACVVHSVTEARAALERARRGATE